MTKNTGIHIQILNQDQPLTCQSDTTILFMLNGYSSVKTGSTVCPLRQGDLVVINALELWSSRLSGICLCLNLDLSYFREETGLCIPEIFSCSALQHGSQESYSRLRNAVIHFLFTCTDKTDNLQLQARALSYQIMDLLCRYFAAISAPSSSEEVHSYISTALTFIHTHAAEPIQIADVARACSIAPAYLSRIFKLQTGISPMNYLLQLRLGQAEKLIRTTSDSLGLIAEKCGFPNLRALETAFQKNYGLQPRQYRTNYFEKGHTADPFSISLTDAQISQQIRNFLPEEQTAEKAAPKNLFLGNFSVNHSQPLHSALFNLVHIGHADILLGRNAQEILTTVQEELRFQFVYLRGIFDHTILICKIGTNNTIQYDFSRLDSILDFILSIGLKPFLELSHMPAPIAEYRADHFEQIHYGISNVSMPKNLSLWNQLIRDFLQHLAARYGTAQISHWKFVPWHYPERMRKDAIQIDSGVIELYKSTWSVFHSYHLSECLGSIPIFPPGCGLSRQGWLDFFLTCKKGNCMPAFLCLHTMPSLSENISDSLQLKTNDFLLAEQMKRVNSALKQLDLADLPVWITEWLPAFPTSNLVNDTIFLAASLAEKLSAYIDITECLALPKLSDTFEETPSIEHEFYGGTGLLTKSGIKKPAYHVMRLFRKLGSQLLGHGPYYIITKDSSSIQILMFYCTPLSFDYAVRQQFQAWAQNLGSSLPMVIKDGTPVQLLYEDRSAIYDGDELFLHLTLQNMESRAYRQVEQIISVSSGNPFETWRNYGSFPEVNAQDADYLNQKGSPDILQRMVMPENGTMEINRLMKPNEVRLIELI